LFRVFNEEWLCFVKKLRPIAGGGKVLFADGEELFEGTVVLAGGVSGVAGEEGEGAFAGHEGAGEGAVDGFGGVAGGDGGHGRVEAAGFDAGEAVDAELDGGEVLDEGGFAMGLGIPGVEELFFEGGEGVADFTERGEVPGGETVDEGVLGGAAFAGFGAGASGFLGIFAVGSAPGFGERLRRLDAAQARGDVRRV